MSFDMTGGKDKQRIEKFKDAFATAGVTLDETILEGKNRKDQIGILRDTLAEAVESSGEKTIRLQGESRQNLAFTLKGIQDSPDLDDVAKSTLIDRGSTLLQSNSADPYKMYTEGIANITKAIDNANKDTRSFLEKDIAEDFNATGDAGGDINSIKKVNEDLSLGLISPLEAKSQLGKIKNAVPKTPSIAQKQSTASFIGGLRAGKGTRMNSLTGEVTTTPVTNLSEALDAVVVAKQDPKNIEVKKELVYYDDDIITDDEGNKLFTNSKGEFVVKTEGGNILLKNYDFFRRRQ